MVAQPMILGAQRIAQGDDLLDLLFEADKLGTHGARSLLEKWLLVKQFAAFVKAVQQQVSNKSQLPLNGSPIIRPLRLWCLFGLSAGR